MARSGVFHHMAFILAITLSSCDSEQSPGLQLKRIPAGAHGSHLFGSFGRSKTIAYDFAFNASAIYDLGNQDQLDWNKLPGLSDCGGFDLAENGAMWAWRWNTADRSLELSPYANVRGRHLSASNTPSARILKIDPEDLETAQPLNYAVEVEGDHYVFKLNGSLRSGQTFDEVMTLPRACRTEPALRYFSGFYFGGTSRAPHDITGYLRSAG